jgi:hypothetical protein
MHFDPALGFLPFVNTFEYIDSKDPFGSAQLFPATVLWPHRGRHHTTFQCELQIATIKVGYHK